MNTLCLSSLSQHLLTTSSTGNAFINGQQKLCPALVGKVLGLYVYIHVIPVVANFSVFAHTSSHCYIKAKFHRREDMPPPLSF